MSNRSHLSIATTAIVLALSLAACGSSAATAAPTSAPTAAPTSVPTAAPTGVAIAATPVPLPSSLATGSSDKCPTAVAVDAVLGTTLPKPVSIVGGAGTTLPAGATGLSCEYAGKTYNVIIQLITNIDPSNISKFSARYPVPYVSVSGVGDQARSFTQTLSAGKVNVGVVATKGTTLVAITATATPASLAQVEVLVNQLL
jgi:hypothetical protein